MRTDLSPIVGTPGVPTAPLGEPVAAADWKFTQASSQGFFLETEQPLSRDPVEVCAELSGIPESGAFASVSGTRRRRSRQSGTGTHVQVETLVRGVRLVGSTVRVHHDEEGIYAITGRPLGEVEARDPGPAPTVDEAEVLDTCAQRFELDDLVGARVEQVVFPLEQGATWAYEAAFVVPEHAADVRVHLRADDLSVLISYNVSSAATGRGSVYPVNPLHTPELIETDLTDLTDPGSLLSGPGINIRQGAGARLERPGGDFTADPSEAAFDEAQTYFHLTAAREYFEPLVGALLLQRPFAPMTATVNDPASPGNAYYRPSTGELSFGLFGSRSSARSASIVVHEFGHAISDAICELGRSPTRNTQARGMSEGYSDYFSAAALSDPRLGAYVANEPDGARNCSDPSLRFPPGHEGEEHDTGAVWAAVLWGIRGRIDPAEADRLAIESLDFLGPLSTFDEGRAALKAVDARLFGGRNTATIDEEYEARG